MTPEGRVKGRIKKWLNWLQAFSFSPVSNGMGVHGIPDYITCLPVVVTPEMVGTRIGIFVGIEAKAPGRRTEPDGGCSPAQVIRMDEIRAAGGFAYVVDSDESIREMTIEIFNSTYGGLQVPKP